jgi:hypothetical protein
VAPRLIPPDPDFASDAERTLWKRLRSALSPDSFLAANVHLHTHDDFYEADLVVGIPEAGFAVIEVKGGQVRRTDAGWEQATPDGWKHIDPAAQADRAKRILDSYVRERSAHPAPLRFEHLVAFPDTDFGPEQPAPDLARWALIARNDLDDAASRVWDALDKRVTHAPRPTADRVAEVADLIGGRPLPATAIAGVAEARADHVRRLTAQQCAVLDGLSRVERLRLVGGPGTGKTWIALEQARRWAKVGKQVLFVCYSRGLARWLAQEVAELDDAVARRITVSTFHAWGLSLGIDVPEGADQAWWDVTAPELMAAAAHPAYDALVVDEDQDFADSWWTPLLAALRETRVLTAGDDQQTVFARGGGVAQLDLVEFLLTKNLRNTTQIAAVFNPLAADRMTFLGGEGPAVRYVACGPEAAHDTADRVVQELLEAGHDPGSIAVLTTRSRHNLHRSVEEQIGKDGYWDGYWMADEVFYGTVMGFKGLERPVVVLAIDGFHDGVARDVMYTGLSRARDQLVVCGDRDLIRSATTDEVTRRICDS